MCAIYVGCLGVSFASSSFALHRVAQLREQIAARHLHMIICREYHISTMSATVLQGGINLASSFCLGLSAGETLTSTASALALGEINGTSGKSMKAVRRACRATGHSAG